jgi:lipopolysaccharide biosynthesis regulator YciM
MQIQTYWLFLIPVLFGLGWLAARWEMRLQEFEDDVEQAKKEKSTFRGINLLLSEQHDKAIDALVEVAQLDPETTELHFALGSLFRRRGETERAIRVHQHLNNREDIRPRDRAHAAYELGRDFLRAGMLDRAESNLNSVMEGRYHLPAKIALLEMYQVEKDWRKAIIAATELETLEQKSYRQQIAHFYCEIAGEAIRGKNITAAKEAIEQALKAVPGHIRATILKGELAIASQMPLDAIATWGQIEKSSPAYLHLITDKWMKAYAELNREEEGLEGLVKHLKDQGAGELLDLVFKHVLRIQGASKAEELMNQVMLDTPSLTAMTKRFEAELLIAQERGQTQEMAQTKAAMDLLKQRTNILARYTCSNCGFRARRFYWQCPGCNHWDVYSPKRSEGVGSL